MSDREYIVRNAVLLSSPTDNNYSTSSRRGFVLPDNDVEMLSIGRGNPLESLPSAAVQSSELLFKPYLSLPSTTNVQNSNRIPLHTSREESSEEHSLSSTVLVRPGKLQEREGLVMSESSEVICPNSIACNVVSLSLSNHDMAPFRIGEKVPIENVVSNCDWLLKSVEDGLRYERAVANYLSEELRVAKSVNEALVKSAASKDVGREKSTNVVRLETKLTESEESTMKNFSLNQNSFPSLEHQFADEHTVVDISSFSPVEKMIIDKLGFIRSILMNAVPLAENSKIPDTSSPRHRYNHSEGDTFITELEAYFTMKDNTFFKRKIKVSTSRKKETKAKNNENKAHIDNIITDIQEVASATERHAQCDNEQCVDMYRSQIEQLQQENRHIQEILLSRHEDPVDEIGRAHV